MDFNNTNFFDVLVVALYLTFITVMLGGTAYLVDQRDWSPWWFLATILFLGTVSVKTGG